MGNRRSKSITRRIELTSEQITELCRQTNLTEDEIRRRHTTFLEQYPNGFMTRHELYDCLNEVWPERHIDKFASHLFAILDEDRDDTIDFGEFLKLTRKLELSENDDENFFGLVFDMFDRNQNGYLEKNELKPLIESIYDLAGLTKDERQGVYSPNTQVKYIIKKFDKNGDKRLSKQEFLDHDNWNHDERLARFLFRS